jgi:GNAT superfamily N-acetyltransferase
VKQVSEGGFQMVSDFAGKYKDLLDSANIDWDVFYPDFNLSPDQMKLLLKEYKMITFKEDGKVRGFCIFNDDCSSLKIERMAVEPDFQFMGIGSKMLSHLVGKLTPKHLGVWTAFNDNWLNFASFLKKNGFTYRAGNDGVLTFSLANAKYVGSLCVK